MTDAAVSAPAVPARILFLTDRSERHQSLAREQAARTLPAGTELRIHRRLAREEALAVIPSADILITERAGVIDRTLIAAGAAGRLRLVLRLGSLTHDIDLPAAKKYHVQVSAQPVSGCIYVAEHLIMTTLAVLKRLGRSLNAAGEGGGTPARTDENTFAYNWRKYSDLRSLAGKTVAILGMGEIGVETARRLKPFLPSRILYHKRTPYPTAVETELGMIRASQEECIAKADVLINLLPYAAETDRALGAAAFAAMKPSACLVHAGSGSVLDEMALLDVLRSGHLAGAALDTYEWEPLPADHPLAVYARDPGSNLLLTPHVAGVGEPGSYLGDFEEIARFLRGEPLRFAVTQAASGY